MPPLTQSFVSNLTKHKIKTQDKRNLILSILKSTTTKREAKNYLNKYRSVNTDTLAKQRQSYINSYLAKQNPFTAANFSLLEKNQFQPLRLSIIKIKQFNSIDIRTLRGICESIRRSIKLGISPVILLDNPQDTEGVVFNQLEQALMEKSNKLMSVMKHVDPELNSTVVRSLLVKRDNEVFHLEEPELVLTPLYQGIIPIIYPIAFDTETVSDTMISANINLRHLAHELNVKYNQILTIEKIIFVDPIGGIPSIERNKTSHVYINLVQEYDDIVSELYIGFVAPANRDLHLANLASMNNVLSDLPSDVTGIITTPQVLSINSDRLNPVLYNILTDRPIISSSLPINGKIPQLTTTILRKGIPISILESETGLDLLVAEKRGELDLAKLVELINDSFRKELDVAHYLNRVNGKIAAVIVAGDYDGAAIITWETSEVSGRKVAYLDKFAVSSRNQGSTGIADIIFKSMVGIYNEEIIWRSRKNNPVNKWYFDRCKGSISEPNSNWKIFYVGDSCGKIKLDKLNIYRDICESIEPSFK